MSTLILKVDLDCCACYKKIRKILCKLQDQEGIRTISYDEGSGTIAVVGPFDPHRLSCKIRCKGGKAIKGIEIIQQGGDGEQSGKIAGPPPMKSNKKKKKGKPKETNMEPHPPPFPEQPPQPPTPPPPVENPPPPAQPAAPDSHISTVMQPTIEEKNQWEMSTQLEPPYEPLPPAPPVEHERPIDQRLQPPPARPVWPVDVKPTTAEIEIPSWPAPPQPIRTAGSSYGCSCCQPCYRGYYEGCRCCNCGRVYGYAVGVLPTPAGCYAGGGIYRPGAGCYAGGGIYRPGCQLYSEEDPASACAVM